MAIVYAALKSSATQQLELWNKSGPHVVTKTYPAAAGLDWAVWGLVMADAFDPDNAAHETALVSAIEALPQFTKVVSPLVCGRTLATIEVNPPLPADPTHELLLHVETQLTGQEGFGADRNDINNKKHEVIVPPADKQWLTFNAKMAGPLDGDGIAAAETALEAITGITVAEHLLQDTVADNVSGGSLKVTSRIRIDQIPVEP